MPRNVARAFANGTRSAGRQTRAEVLAEQRRLQHLAQRRAAESTISGSEEITYTNNSPNTLDRLVFRLELNKHQPEAPREVPGDTTAILLRRSYRRIFRERKGESSFPMPRASLMRRSGSTKSSLRARPLSSHSNGTSISPSTATRRAAAKA